MDFPIRKPVAVTFEFGTVLHIAGNTSLCIGSSMRLQASKCACNWYYSLRILPNRIFQHCCKIREWLPFGHKCFFIQLHSHHGSGCTGTIV